MKQVLGAVLVVGAACGRPPPPPPPPQTIVLELRTANPDGGTPIPYGEFSTLTPGAQGGFHVWMNVRVSGASGASPHLKHSIRVKADDKLISTGERTLAVGSSDADAGWDNESPWPAFLCPSPVGINVIGVPAVLRLQALDDDGGVLSDTTAQTTFQCPQAQLAFCQSICSG